MDCQNVNKSTWIPGVVIDAVIQENALQATWCSLCATAVTPWWVSSFLDRADWVQAPARDIVLCS